MSDESRRGSAAAADPADPRRERAPDDPPEEPYLAAAAADRWDVLRYDDEPEPVHRAVPAGAGSSVVTTYRRRARSRRRITLALVPVALVGLPAGGWLLAGTAGLLVGAAVAAATAAVVARRHLAADGLSGVPAVVDASVPAERARSYGLENAGTVAEAAAYLDANPAAAPDRSPEEALEAARRGSG